MIYSNLRDTAGQPVGLRCEDGLIAEIGPHLADAPGVAGEGWLLLPALVEPHCHLDKTLWGEPWQQGPGAQTLRGWIENERRVLSACKTPVAVRAGRLMEQMLICGTTAIRSHVDVAPDMGLSHVEAMLEVKQAWAPRMDLQLVAFPQQGVISRPGTLDLLREAMTLGVETIGGLDPAGIDGDPDGQLRGIFDLAQRFDRGVDIHLHDKGALGAWQIRRIADYTEASGLAGRVMISHAYCLGMISESELTAIGERLASLKISLMTSAPGDVAVPPVARLTELGVNVCCGSDGIRDAWSPLGKWRHAGTRLSHRLPLRLERGCRIRACPLLRHLPRRHRDRLSNRGLTVGAVADFLMVDALNIGDALARRPQRRRVGPAMAGSSRTTGSCCTSPTAWGCPRIRQDESKFSALCHESRRGRNSSRVFKSNQLDSGVKPDIDDAQPEFPAKDMTTCGRRAMWPHGAQQCAARIMGFYVFGVLYFWGVRCARRTGSAFCIRPAAPMPPLAGIAVTPPNSPSPNMPPSCPASWNLFMSIPAPV